MTQAGGFWVNTTSTRVTAVTSWVLQTLLSSRAKRNDSQRESIGVVERPAISHAILGEMPSTDPKSVKVNLTTGTGVDIEWKDGHQSHYAFPYLRDACPCALCDEERGKVGREPGQPPKTAPGALPMFKALARPESADGVGKYAIKFHWNDGHELGIYSWQFLRDWCPCEECKAARAAVKTV